MKYMTYLTLLAATLLLACQQVSDSRAEADFAEIKSQLDDIEENFLNTEVSIAAQIKKYLEFFVADPVLLPPGEDAVQGYDAALAYYTEGFEGGTVLDVDFQTPDILLDGDMAVRRYIGSSEIMFDSGPYSSYNRYIDILQRQPDGEWLTVWHTWTPMDR